MRVRLLACALQFCFLISISTIDTGVVSAQEKQNCTLFAPSSISDINRIHVSVGDFNRANNDLNSNIFLFGETINGQEQDINSTHISVGDFNRANNDLNSNIFLFGETINGQEQDINNTHVSVGDINCAPDQFRAETGLSGADH